MTQYLIIRYGSNVANQSMVNRMPVEIVEAKNRNEAKRLFSGTVYNNQYLEAIPESKARKSDWNEAVENQLITREAR